MEKEYKFNIKELLKTKIEKIEEQYKRKENFTGFSSGLKSLDMLADFETIVFDIAD